MNTLVNTISIALIIVIGLYLIIEYKKAGSWKDVFTYEEIIEEEYEVIE